MKIMDNSPMEVPAIGRLVTEKYALGQFVDCCLYLLPSNTQTIASKAKEIVDELFQPSKRNLYLNSYDFEVLEKMPVLDNHPQLNSAIEEAKCNFILPLNTPHLSGKQYLLLHSEEEDLFQNLALMFYTSERISKNSVKEVLRQFALFETDDFCKMFGEVVDFDKFYKNYFANKASSAAQPNFGMRPSMTTLRKALDIEGEVTFRKKSEMIERMKENILKYRKNRDKKADAELSYILDSIDVDTFLVFLSELPKYQIEKFCDTANPQRQAEESKMSFEVKYVGAPDSLMSTDGKYRLFLRKDFDQIQVHFKRKDSFVLYLIYLIDKLRNETVDSLDIKGLKQQFVKLYEEVYPGDDGTSRFDSMIKHVDGKGNPRQAQIKHCYADIRESVGDACEKMREPSAPFVLKDAQDHLFVLKERILIDDALLKLAGNSK